VTGTASSFPSGRPPLHPLNKAPYNVLLVPDVTPYEMMKMHLLNGSHLIIGYLGHLSGYQYIFEIMHEDFKKYITSFMDNEVTPTLLPVPGIDLEAYKQRLRGRFANPNCKDSPIRVCRQGATKLPKFLLPTVRRQLKNDGTIECSCIAVAAWLRFLNHHDEKGEAIKVEDSRAEQLHLVETAEKRKADAAAILEAARDVFEELCDNKRFVEEVQQALSLIYEKGAKAALHQWVQEKLN